MRKKIKIKLLLIVVFILPMNNYLLAQSITSISVPGATASGGGSAWSASWTSNSADSNLAYVKPVKLYLSNFKSSDDIFMSASNTSSIWQMQFGATTSNAWKTFCYSKNVGSNTDSITIYIRNKSGTKGTYTNNISIGVGSCSSGTVSFTLSITVEVVDAGVYTWIGTSGTDSLYTTPTNWTPTRSNPLNSDVLVCDLGSAGLPLRSTIDISGVTQTIGQFRVFPQNNLTFKCTTTNSNWTIGNSPSIAGADFYVDTTATIRKSGNAILNIIVPSGNSLDINGKVDMIEGGLTFNGIGQHNISGNITTYGGTLRFHPSSSSYILNLDGMSQTLANNTGTLYIDSTVDVVIGAVGKTSTFTLSRSLPLYSKLTLLPNTTIVSNSPASSSAGDWNAWTPHLQFKWFNQVGSKAFGELAVMPTGASITGGGLVEILNSTKRAYRTVGIPLKNAANLSQFVDDIHLTGTVTDGANKDSFTTSCSWCKSSIFRWNENTAAWVAYTSGSSANKIDPGKGVLVFFRGARAGDWGLGDTSIVANSQIIDFKGQLQTGDVTVTGLVKSNGGTLDGANLIANPYPSTLNFRTFYEGNKANILPRYYTYDALAKNYNSWDSSVGSTPQKGGASWFQNAGGDTRYINPGAAFFVFARSNSASISFTEAMKEASKRSKGKNFEVEELSETPCNEFKMTVNYVTDTAKESDGFTMQYDLNIPDVTNDGEMYDAPKFYGGFLGLGSITANNQWLAVDRRAKLAEIGNTHTIPLKVAYPKNGPTDLFFTIKSCSYGNGPYKIQLVDKVLNTTEEVGDNSIYQYSIATTDEKRSDRFDVIFTAVQPAMNTKTYNSLIRDYIVYPNPATDGQFNVVNNKTNRVRRIEIFNAQGQLVKTISNCTTDLISINLNASSGIYTAVITGDKNSETHRIAIP